MRIPVIRNPLSTKNKSTPIQPLTSTRSTASNRPLIAGQIKWQQTTANNATPRTPSSAGTRPPPSMTSGSSDAGISPNTITRAPRHTARQLIADLTGLSAGLRQLDGTLSVKHDPITVIAESLLPDFDHHFTATRRVP